MFYKIWYSAEVVENCASNAKVMNLIPIEKLLKMMTALEGLGYEHLANAYMNWNES